MTAAQLAALSRVAAQASAIAVAGLEVIRTQGGWVAAVESHADIGLLRNDGLATLRAIVWVLASYADWETMTTRPGLDNVLERLSATLPRPIGLRQLQRWLRWLEGRGLLWVLEDGSTPQFRPAILREDDEGNLAREWLLTRPLPAQPDGRVHDSSGQHDHEHAVVRLAPVHEDVTPSGFSNQEENEQPTARARVRVDQAVQHHWPLGETPKTRSEMLAAAEELRRHSLVLRQMSAEMVRHLARPYWEPPSPVGPWSARDVLYGLDHLQDGAAHWHTDEIRDPAGWARHRLGLWTGPDGTPVPGRAAQLRATAERDRARAAADRAAIRKAFRPDGCGSATSRRPSTASEGAAAARGMLAARNPESAAAKIIALGEAVAAVAASVPGRRLA